MTARMTQALTGALYSEQDIRAYATGMASATGVDVKLHDGDPKTDGKTVWVPLNPIDSQIHYEAMCGTCNHEISHVQYLTVQTFKDLPKLIANKHGADWAAFAAHECMNAVVDITDETRMEKLMPGTAQAFRTSNLVAAHQLYENVFTNANYGDGTGMPCWRWALVNMILNARLQKRKASWLNYRNTYFDRQHLHLVVDSAITGFSGEAPTPDGYDEVIQIGMKCRTGAAKRPTRTTRANNTILTLAERLFRIILPFVKPADEPKDGGGGKSVDDVMNEARDKGTAEAAAAGKGSSGHGPSGRIVTMDRAFALQVKHGMSKAVEVLMETSDSMAVTRLDSVGRKLGRRWPNLYTNGKVFVNPEKAPGHELGCAILVDRSSSVRHELPMISAAAYTMSEVLVSNGADVDTWLFGLDTEHRPWQHLNQPIETQGATNGAPAILAATQWLEGVTSGRRLICVITDGDLHDKEQAMPHICRAVSRGIEFFLIGIGMTLDSLRAGWSGALPAIACQTGHELTEALIRHIGPARL